VERVNQYPLYEMGKSLQAIVAYKGDAAATAALWDVFNAGNVLDQILAGNPFPIGVSRGAAQSLRAELSGIWTQHFTGPVKPDGTRDFRFPETTDAPIPAWRWNSLQTALARFETIFAAEIAEGTTYFVPRRGIYSTPALVDTADEAFPETLRGYIPEKTKVDWKAAGRCLAFSLLSASGFHVARAVEGTLEAYYQLYTGKPDATLRSWDDYFKELTKIAAGKPTPSPESRTLAELDQMRQDYRNPLMHPRVTLNDADAQILFNNGESLIIGMASEICKARSAQGGVQPALALVAPATADS
jgi:hypothetical protein